jgi:hypothetical protein
MSVSTSRNRNAHISNMGSLKRTRRSRHPVRSMLYPLRLVNSRSGILFWRAISMGSRPLADLHSLSSFFQMPPTVFLERRPSTVCSKPISLRCLHSITNACSRAPPLSCTALMSPLWALYSTPLLSRASMTLARPPDMALRQNTSLRRPPLTHSDRRPQVFRSYLAPLAPPPPGFIRISCVWVRTHAQHHPTPLW